MSASLARPIQNQGVVHPFRGRGSIAEASKASDAERTRIILRLLEYVERRDEQSQRPVASEFCVVLDFASAYLRRCTRKGLVKAGQTPARRYAYDLTPRGRTEKSQSVITKFGAERGPTVLGMRPVDSWRDA